MNNEMVSKKDSKAEVAIDFMAPTKVKLSRDFGADHDVLVSLIPEKMAFKIGEVAELLGLKTHVLRYWETEFNALKPKKSRHNQRMYSRQEIEILLVIRKFLYVDKFSISGARKALRQWKKDRRNKTEDKVKSFEQILEQIKGLKTEIVQLKSHLVL